MFLLIVFSCYYYIESITNATKIIPINIYCFFFNFSFKKILDNITVTILYAAIYGEAIAASPNAKA